MARFLLVLRPMRNVLLGVILALTAVSPVGADGGLTAAVASVYGQRTLDADLHTIAHARVAEISACAGCMNHDLARPGTAEVLGYNSGQPDPIGSIVSGWQSSALHNGILSSPDLGRIGCAETIVGDGHFFACVLASGGALIAPPPSSGGTLSLPDTAMR